MKQLLQTHRPGSARRVNAPSDGGEEGFTLIEILIAITVLVIGLLGILSLFPFSMNNIRETAEFTEASTIASSFHQSLLTGVHNAGTRGDVVTIHHSGVFNQGDGIKEKYTFSLPEDPLAGREEDGEDGQQQAVEGATIPPETVWIPCAGGHPLCPPTEGKGNVAWGGGGTAAGERGQYRWQFGTTFAGGQTSGATATDLSALVENIEEEFDPTISTDQYSVAILIRNRAFYPENLYEVLIRVYRSFTRDVDIPNRPGGEQHKDLIREYRAKLSR